MSPAEHTAGLVLPSVTVTVGLLVVTWTVAGSESPHVASEAVKTTAKLAGSSVAGDLALQVYV